MGDAQPRGTSFFQDHTIEDLEEQIRETYLSNHFPWVVGYSGGKDSTVTLQAIWYALSKLPPEKRQKPVFVISSDTLVETPVIVEYINTTLERIQKAGSEQDLPITSHKVVPQIKDTFWVNLLGRGYPAPSQRFRWCTERMKIKPANQFVLESAAEFGEVVMILGARKNESMSRDQVMNDQSRKIAGSRLTRHSSLPRAYVYTPIQDFTTDDVWAYLLQVPSPWGGNNRDLAAMYQNTSSGECPLVVDSKTPSCGNSRFGCWVCTVVERDRTMQALIDNGEEWMEPLLDFRDRMAETQDPARKREFREFKRRDGQVIIRDGKTIPGPYKFSFRKQLLKELLQLQKDLQVEGPDPDLILITSGELHEIRRLWRKELSDWEDCVPQIYRDVFNEDLDWVQDELGNFSADDQALLKEICDKNQVPSQLVTRLIDLERDRQGMGRRAGIFSSINNLFKEEWQSEEDVARRRQEEQEVREAAEIL